MNGATIQERPCPRCAIRRTVLIGGASFCHNCHLHWDGVSSAAFGPRVERPYVFTATEEARLAIYRNAVRAGFYTDY